MTCPSCQAENEASATVCARCGAELPPAPTTVLVSVDLSPGALFHGRYEIVGLLGRGGMGMVYKARDRTLDEVVAIKVLRPDFAQDPTMAQRFKSEIKMARKIRHRNVCAIHDFGEEKGLLYISMELIEGVDLKHILRERGGLPPEEAYDIAIQVAEGLQAVHEAGIIHRDLKTPNIMRDARGVARLMDFGIAKRQGAEGTITATGQVVGTPEYMSPEQAQGRRIDFRSDIYALGIVTYEIFTGQVPFRGETPISTILKHLQDPPPLEGPQAARLPPSLKPVLRQALAKDPAERHATASRFAEALKAARNPALRQQPLATVMLEAPTLPRGQSARRPRAWLIALLLAAAGAVLLLFRQRAGAPPADALPLATPASITRPGMAAPPATTASTPPETEAAAPKPAPAPAATPTPRPAPPPTAAARVRAPSPQPTAPTAPSLAPTPAPPVTNTPAPPVGPPPAPAPVLAGLLQVAVRPWGEVAVDGKVVGTTPIDRIPLSPGRHTILVRHPAYEPLERTVVVPSGQTAKLIVDLPTEGVRKP